MDGVAADAVSIAVQHGHFAVGKLLFEKSMEKIWLNAVAEKNAWHWKYCLAAVLRGAMAAGLHKIIAAWMPYYLAAWLPDFPPSCFGSRSFPCWLHSAANELEGYRWLDCLPVVLQKANGPNASKFNGTYFYSSEPIFENGKPVFTKIADETSGMCTLKVNEHGSWFVATVTSTGRTIYAYTEEGLAHPTLAKKWMVVEDDAASPQQQPIEASVMVTTCPPLSQPSHIQPTLLYHKITALRRVSRAGEGNGRPVRRRVCRAGVNARQRPTTTRSAKTRLRAPNKKGLFFGKGI